MNMNGRNQRRGIALLFVISLIVLFFLFATTFVAMSSSYMRTSRQRVRTARLTQYKPNHIMDDVFMMLLRDVPEGMSHPLAGQSLLADQYGLALNGNGAFATIASSVVPQAAYGNSVVMIESVDPNLQINITDSRAGLYKDSVVGRWLTFVDGPAKNLTFPVIDYHSTADVAATPGRFFIMLQPSNSQWVSTPANLAAMAGARFLINGRPFDGFDIYDNAGRVVLRPATNEPFDAVEAVEQSSHIASVSLRNNRNLFLARNQPGNNAYAVGEQVVPSFHRYDPRFTNYAGNLLNDYLTSASSYSYGELTGLASTTLRPLPWENPNFNGSNPNWDFYGATLANSGNGYGDPFRYRFNSVVNIGGVNVPISFDPTLATHWAHYFALLSNDPNSLNNSSAALNLPINAMMDVDNDGDGINDSFWMDVGAAPIVMADGTRVKPLVAVQIEDMDGRANLNTLGSIAQGTQAGNITVGGIQLPYGSGYGPAEVLAEPLGLDATNLGNLLQLRYGIVGGVAGGPDATYNAPSTNGLDRANLMGAPETYPNFNPAANYGSGLVGDAYGTPADYQGQFVVAANSTVGVHRNNASAVNTFLVPFLPHHQLDMVGANSFPRFGSGTRELTQFVDNPYSFDVFSGKTGSQAVVAAGASVNDQDIKLGPEVLEALLRANDSDFNHLAHLVRASIFDPLRKDLIATFDPVTDQINGGLLSLLRVGNRNLQVTTESMEVPAVPFSVAQMVRERLMDSLINRDGAAATAQLIDTHVLSLIGPELVAGLPIDLNRPFGNGRDDDGDLVYDEPGEINTYEYRGYNVPTGTDGLPADLDRIPLDMNNNGIPSTTAGEVEVGMRQILARNLYVLMLTLFSRNPNLNAAQVVADPAEYRFRVTLAQWAVNVVDFRDQDSIMTPFEFDLDPFNGWDADGDLRFQQAHERRVWGVERPDLLLTEARADHQHRSSRRTTAAAAPHHQAHLPNPSAFFEVYNPWLVPDNLGLAVGAVANPRHQQINNDVGGQVTFGPGNVYTQTGVELNKATPVSGHPVYRVLIVKDEDLGMNPDKDLSAFDELMLDHLDSGSGQSLFNSTSIERTVFFTNPFNLDDFINNTYVAPSGADAAVPSPIQLTNGTVQHYPEYTGYSNRYVLLPGHHAVVGSAGPHENANFYTIFGRNINNWTPNTDLDPAAGHLEGRPYIRLEPDQPVEVGTFDATGATSGAIQENSLSVPLNRTLSETYWNSFAVSGALTGYSRDGSGVPLDGTGAATNTVQELDGWYFETAGAYPNPFHGGQDNDWEGYGYNTTGDVEDWSKQIVLQRLANPQLDFDPIQNPYITLDDLRIDITASGGLDRDPAVVASQPGHYSVDRGDPVDSNPKFAFNNGAPVAAAARVYQPQDPGTADPASTNPWLRTLDGAWQADDMTLDGQANVPADILTAGGRTSSFGVLNTTFQSTTEANPWLTFNNRPFVSEGELEMVPIQSNGLLLEHVVWPGNENGEAYEDDFIRSLTQQNNTAILDANARTPSYLPNFLASQNGIQRRFGGIDTPVAGLTRSYSQVFDFVDVPSRFNGTRQLLDPVTFGGDVPRYISLGAFDLDMPFNAPYNWLSNRREPGKINLNTLNWENVWKSLMGSTLGAQSAYESEFTFAELIDRRENDQRFFQPESNPLRPAFTADSTVTPLESSMWGHEDPSTGSGSRPMWEVDNSDPAYNTRSTPYFRNQGRQRLLNMTTNRSSVFAVRLTVGYFRLEEMKVPVVIEASRGKTYDTLVPGDFRVEWRTTIGQEYGIESGTTKRDRAFYLIDRSIPVGFVPGENLNVEDTILLKRYIE